MSDFAELVRKINEIDNSNTSSIKRTKSTNKSNLDTSTAAMADILSKVNNNGNPYVPVKEKPGLVETFNKIDETKKKDAKEAEQTMQDRFAQFLKAEKSAGADISTMKSDIEEGVAEYELADKGFKKILEMINMLEKMVKEGGTLEKRLVAAAGMETARLQPLADMRQALSDAYDACEDAYQDAMGDFVVGEEKEDNTK